MPTPDSLFKCLATLNDFVSKRSEQVPIFREVAQEIPAIGQYLQQGKLTCKIFGQSPALSQALQQFFLVSPPLTQLYDLRLMDLPEGLGSPAVNAALTTLTLQANDTIGHLEYGQELNANRGLLVGRSLSSLRKDYRATQSVLLDLPKYDKVSGVHAVIAPVPNSTPLTWQVTDLGSKNGTFVNDKLLPKEQSTTLKDGDVISFAYESDHPKAAKFIFHSPIAGAIVTPQLRVAQGDLVCLVVNPEQGLSEQENQLIYQISQAKIVAFLLLLNYENGTGLETAQRVKLQLKAVLEKQYPHLKDVTEISPFSLLPFYPKAPHETVQQADPQMVEIYQFFCSKILVPLHQAKGKGVILEEAQRRLMVQLQRLDGHFQGQSQRLSQERQQWQEKLKGQEIEDYQLERPRVVRKVREDREDFFYHNRRKMEDGQRDIVNFFARSSLLNQIKDEVMGFMPIVEQGNGQFLIRLKRNQGDGHDFLVALIRRELQQKVLRDWEETMRDLDNLGERSYQRLNFIPGLSLSDTFQAYRQHPNVDKLFKDSFVAAQNHLTHAYGGTQQNDQQAMVDMGIQGGAVLLSAMFGSPMAIFQGISLVSNLGKFFAKKVSQPEMGQRLSEYEIEEHRLSAIVAQLQNQNISYYQNLAKFLADQLYKEILEVLVRSSSLFDRALNDANDQIDMYFQNVAKYQKEYALKGQSLQQELAAFEAIKRLVN